MDFIWDLTNDDVDMGKASNSNNNINSGNHSNRGNFAGDVMNGSYNNSRSKVGENGRLTKFQRNLLNGKIDCDDTKEEDYQYSPNRNGKGNKSAKMPEYELDNNGNKIRIKFESGCHGRKKKSYVASQDQEQKQERPRHSVPTIKAELSSPDAIAMSNIMSLVPSPSGSEGDEQQTESEQHSLENFKTFGMPVAGPHTKKEKVNSNRAGPGRMHCKDDKSSGSNASVKNEPSSAKHKRSQKKGDDYYRAMGVFFKAVYDQEQGNSN